jgi:hypothetical protein
MALEGLRWLGARVAFAYIALYGVWALTGLVPAFAPVSKAYVAAWKPVIDVVARVVLGHGDLDPTNGGTGSGDSIYGWMFVLTNALVAVLAAAVWTASDRRRSDRLVPMATECVRLVVASNMVAYGAMKVFSSQFPDLHPIQLAMPLGEYSPMALLWTFMGYSEAYEVFTGIVELLAGALLLLPTTRFLGSLVALGATAQVLMLNLCFDVPVKIFAGHLFLGSLWLVVVDGRRWFPALVLGRPLAPEDPRPPSSDRMRRLARVARLALIATLLVGYGHHFLTEDHTDDLEQATARAEAAEYPLMRHRTRWVDDRTSMWD